MFTVCFPQALGRIPCPGKCRRWTAPSTPRGHKVHNQTPPRCQNTEPHPSKLGCSTVTVDAKSGASSAGPLAGTAHVARTSSEHVARVLAGFQHATTSKMKRRRRRWRPLTHPHYTGSGTNRSATKRRVDSGHRAAVAASLEAVNTKIGVRGLLSVLYSSLYHIAHPAPLGPGSALFFVSFVFILQLCN